MRGDFSRLTFRPEKHYSGVRLQQGRVQLDSEFNEHVDIEAYRDRETARDVIGRAGAPQDGGGFRVAIATLLRGVAAAGDRWAVGEDGTVLRAPAGEKAWTLEPRPANSGRLNAVDFAADDLGWAVGDAAAIYRLASAGPAAAEALPEGVTADLHGVHVANATAAWAVGGGGTVLGYDGTDWTLQDSGIAATLRAVHFTDGGELGWAVGDAGTIIATDNQGADWEVRGTPPGTGDLHGVSVVDKEHCWVVGEQGTILFFDGAQWTAQGSSPALTARLRAVVFTSAAEGTAVGDDATIASTTDGGATWTRAVVDGVSADLHGVAAVSDGGLVAVGDDVTLASDAGGEWSHRPKLPVDANTHARAGRTLSISAGDMYVDGVRCENERTVSLSGQPEPPLAGLYRAAGLTGTFGVYLQVQEQHLTAVEREELREVALGGPDTATRTRTVWQADLVKIGAPQPGCADVTAAVRPDPPRGRLRARAKPAAVSAGDCIVPPSGGYERLENQLYRVEIHGRADSGDGMTFKWSRDNGSVVARLQLLETRPGTGVGKPTGTITVSDVGRDATHGFAPDQLVEITDEGRMLRGVPGVIAEIGEIRGNELLLENLDEAPLTMADFPDRPLVRRWDGRADVRPTAQEHDPATGLFERELESGVFVAFADGPDPADSFRTGDYWTIPARTLSGAVEWPSEGGVPSFEQRHGPQLTVAPLALVAIDAEGRCSNVRDCRKLFPPLTDLVHMYYVGGDGQETMPTTLPLSAAAFVALDRPVQVGIANGRRPVVGATVDFAITGGSGRFRLPDGTFPAAAAVLTDENGIATCEWELDGATPTQLVESRLRDPLGQSPPQVQYFGAHLSIASEVAYDGTPCARLAGSSTVQTALDALARLTRIFPLTGSGEDLRPGEIVDIEVLVADQCGPVDDATVQFVADAGGAVTEVKGTTVAGIASCRWVPDATTPTQHLVATLQSVPSGVVHPPAEARFTANLNLASDTQYTPPDKCPELAGVETVQAAIDRLVARLPRLYHVAGDGLEGAAGEAIALRAGIANRCGVEKPRVRFERKVIAPGGPESWTELEIVTPEADLIATHHYELTGDAGQVVRARMMTPVGDKTLGDPVYFNLALAGTAEKGIVPAARLEVRQSGQVAEVPEGTVVEFHPDSALFDTDAMFDPGANPTGLRASRSGTYLATAELSWDNTAAGSRGVEILRNGEPIATVSGAALPQAGKTLTQQATTIMRLDGTDFVQMAALHEAHGGVEIAGAVLAIAWLGP
jgi:photosystem II stability/assembly factor-like uncharacterized protein